jgi:hypothetical protein
MDEVRDEMRLGAVPIKSIALGGAWTTVVGCIFLPWVDGYSPTLRKGLTQSAVEYSFYGKTMLLFGVGALVLVVAQRYAGAMVASGAAGAGLLGLYQDLSRIDNASISAGLYITAVAIVVTFAAAGRLWYLTADAVG